MPAINPVVVEFIARGVPDVQRAIRGVAETLQDTERRATGTARTESSSRLREAEREAREKVAAWKRADATLAAAQRVGARQAAEALREETQAASRAANERIRIAQRVANEERRIRAEILRDKITGSGITMPQSPALARLAQVSSPAARLAALDAVKQRTPQEQQAAIAKVQELRVAHDAVEQVARRESKAADQAAKDKIRALQAADKAASSARDHGVREAEKAAREEVRIAERAEQDKTRAAAASYEKRKQFAKVVMGAGGTAVKNAVATGARAATAVAGGVLQLGGGFSITDSLQQRVALRGKLADISNRGIMKGDAENEKRRSVDELQGKVSSVGVQYGIDPDKAAEGLDKFASKTGKLKTGMDLLSGLAEMSRAGAGNLDDLADAAGDVFNTDTTQSADQVLTVMRALAAQGKIGAVEMKDLASQMAALGAAAGRFQGDAGKNMATMGGLAQLARQSGGAKSASQATTAVTSLTNQFYKNARIEGFKALGVKTKDETTGFNRNIDDVLIETMLGAEKKSRASGRGLGDFDVNFGHAVADAQARRATLPLERVFKEAGGGQKGADAARAKLKEFAGASMSKEEVTSNANARMKEADAQLEVAMLKLRNTAADQLTPVLVNKLIPALEKGIPVFKDLLDGAIQLAEWISNNPLKSAFIGLGAAATKAVVGELLAAKLGEVIKGMLGGGGGGVPGAGGAGGGGVGAALGAGAVAGAITYATVRPGIDAVLRGQETGQSRTGETLWTLKHGTQEQKEKAAAGVQKLDEQYGGAKGRLQQWIGAAGAVPWAAYSGITGEKNEGAQQIANTQSAREVISNDEVRNLAAAILANTKATQAAAAAGGNGGAARGPADPASASRAQPIPKRSTQ